MTEVLRLLYNLARDFAGPVATVLAACVAAYFVRQQALMSRRVALDQLRFDLFEKRYAIYSSVRDMIRSALNDTAKPNFGAWEMMGYYVMVREARFFFAPATCLWLDELVKEVQDLIQAAAGEKYSAMSGIERSLINRAEELQGRFQEELEFRQLTNRN